MANLADAIQRLESIAPLALAEDWDNVGLLVGDPDQALDSALTCLTLSPDVAQEAIERGVQLVVTHHPLPFREVRSLSTATIDGGALWRLCRAGIAVYSAHTAYDSAVGGVNDQWAAALELEQVTPLVETPERSGGVGRVGTSAAESFEALVERVRGVVGAHVALRVTPPGVGRSPRVAIACGSGGSLLNAALEKGADVFLTGELGFHDCLQCRSRGVGVVLTGHYASERFAMESLAVRLGQMLPGVTVTASGVEADPLRLAR